MSWLGRSGGSPAMASQQSIVLPVDGVGILKVNYGAAFTAYRLNSVPWGINQVLVFAQGAVS
jgi:hypothetical protein